MVQIIVQTIASSQKNHLSCLHGQ